MGGMCFRLYLDDKAATQDQLDQVDEIVVDQEMDRTWQARLQILMSTDDKGNWKGAHPTFVTGFARIRIEVDPGDGTFQALIDGPIIGTDTAMQSEPGQSRQTVLVHDDSVLLNRDERAHLLGKKSDDQVAKDLFDGAKEHIRTTKIDTTKQGSDGTATQFQRMTDMQLLRQLAKRNGMHAYVLPGDTPGASVGVFKALKTTPEGKPVLPPLVLIGKDRNMDSFTTREDAQAPATITGQTLSVMDKSISKAKVSFRNVDILGAKAAGESVRVGATRILPPGRDGLIDVEAAVKGAAERHSYSFMASGRISTGMYPAVLSPYRVVTVKGVKEEHCGDYVIKSVNHRLTRSLYAQAFELTRNGRSAAGGGGGLSLPGIN